MSQVKDIYCTSFECGFIMISVGSNNSRRIINVKVQLICSNTVYDIGSIVSGYHADTPITIKAEASRKADSRIH